MAEVRLDLLNGKHAESMYRWMRDPEVAENLGLRGEPSLERTRIWLANAVADDDVRAFAISLDDRHVGNVVLDRIDRHLGTCRLSVYIGEPSARGGGVGKMAVAHACVVAFGPLELHKVWLTVHCRNAAALNAYLAIGFVIEGVLRHEFLLRGRRLDAFRLGLLAGELIEPSPKPVEVP